MPFQIPDYFWVFYCIYSPGLELDLIYSFKLEPRSHARAHMSKVLSAVKSSDFSLLSLSADSVSG